MYSTCLFCRAPLGANEMIEPFPVGQRLAFDPARGRLWVVCPSCRQWNLSPLDERWEAIESAERLYRDTRLRVATAEIGLARLRDGTELVRIGQPLRPEFAAWRYGARFEARWRRHAGLAVAGGALLTGYIVAGPVMGLIAGGVGALPLHGYMLVRNFVRGRLVVGQFHDEQGPIVVTDVHLRRARVLSAPDDPQGWQLSIPHLKEYVAVGKLTRATDELDSKVVLTGQAALDAARVVLPRLNRAGGRRRTVEEAVKVLDESGTVHASFLRAARTRGRDEAGDPSHDLASLDPALRLALEMAAHEEVERQALEGELALLELAWREAEEIAAISDDLTLPERVIERLSRLRG